MIRKIKGDLYVGALSYYRVISTFHSSDNKVFPKALQFIDQKTNAEIESMNK